MVNCVVQKQKNVDSKIYFNGSINFDKMSKFNVHLTQLLQLLRNFVPQIPCHDCPWTRLKKVLKVLHSPHFGEQTNQ